MRAARQRLLQPPELPPHLPPRPRSAPSLLPALVRLVLYWKAHRTRGRRWRPLSTAAADFLTQGSERHANQPGSSSQEKARTPQKQGKPTQRNERTRGGLVVSEGDQSVRASEKEGSTPHHPQALRHTTHRCVPGSRQGRQRRPLSSQPPAQATCACRAQPAPPLWRRPTQRKSARGGRLLWPALDTPHMRCKSLAAQCGPAHRGYTRQPQVRAGHATPAIERGCLPTRPASASCRGALAPRSRAALLSVHTLFHTGDTTFFCPECVTRPGIGLTEVVILQSDRCTQHPSSTHLFAFLGSFSSHHTVLQKLRRRQPPQCLKKSYRHAIGRVSGWKNPCVTATVA